MKIKIVDQFMLKSFLGPMILSFLIVMFVLMMNFMWRYIDELVGKGLTLSVIAELMMYGAMTLIPMGLPLATLFAAIMTMGNLGENYELIALKSSGVSLPRIMRSLTIITVFVAIGSFFVANNLVPFAYREMRALLSDIRNQGQSIEFKDGIFFNGIPNYSIRVERQNQNTKLLTGVLIYDNSDRDGKMSTTIAKTGYINLSEDKKNLVIKLYEGESFEHSRTSKWGRESELQRTYFDTQELLIETSGFDFERSDGDSFASMSEGQTIQELSRGLDSIAPEVTNKAEAIYTSVATRVFEKNTTYYIDSLRADDTHVIPTYVIDSLPGMTREQRMDVWRTASRAAENTRSSISYDEIVLKDSLHTYYRDQSEWHRKLSLPVSIIIFFLIGAPLGAIIRKGGLGMPVIISVIFFVIYYVISISGEKMTKEGSWTSMQGMWFSTMILLPVAIFLTYKAANDSNLFNAERYLLAFKRVKRWIKGENKQKKSKK